MTDASTIPTAATPDVCTFTLLVDGMELSGAFQVVSVDVAKELNRIPSATIELRDGEASQSTFQASNTDHFIPGKKIEIQLGYRAENVSVFKGMVIRHSIRIRKNSNQLTIECRDAAVKMTTDAKSHYFTDKKDSDIIQEIFDSYGLKTQIEATGAKHEEVVQYNATDWDFVLCRAEANGQVVMVDDGKVNVFRPATDGEPVVAVRYGATLIELDAEIDARWQSKAIKATSWSAADQGLLEADATEPSATGSGNLSAADLAEAVAGDTHVIRHGGGLSQTELQAWADARLLKERFAKVRGRARFQGFAGVAPGRIIEVNGIGERFEGKMYVSGVHHSMANGNWETDVQFGLNPQLFAQTYSLRPLPAAGLLPSVNGLQIGVVTALEADPAGEGRIRIRLPLVGNSEEGVWARIATLDAGNQRGTFFRPEIGDEVAVGFLDNDPRHPIVLGMCHSSAKPAPEAGADANHRKGYVSREKMQFVFDDEKKSIVLETPGGNKVTLSEDAKNIIIEDQNGNTITLDDSGIKIESSKDLTLKAANDIKLESMNIDVKAQAAFKAAGAASAELSAASTTVKGSATTVIQGGMVQIN